MANPGSFHAHSLLRFVQIVTLIAAWALLASIVSQYNSAGSNTPGSLLFLFIVCILASVWSFCILLAVIRAKNTALWIAFWDLVAMGLLIAAVAVNSRRANYDCGLNAIGLTSGDRRYVVVGDRTVELDTELPQRGRDGTDFWRYEDQCGKLRPAWALAITNIVLFFLTAVLAAVIYRQNVEEEKRRRKPIVEKVYVPVEPEYPERPRRARKSRSRGRSRSGSAYV